ncbi:glycosyltransferase [Pirellulales bacterium]|nr:glycosyltransferase [Pirellulales bacterium]
MNIWLIHPAEPVPISGNTRLFRYGKLCGLLAKRGHVATQWASTFDHFSKQQRTRGDCLFEVEAGYRVQLVYGSPYKKHVGFARMRSQREVAENFTKCAKKSVPPDVIVVSLPTLELATTVLAYAEARKIPVVVDIRDLWPDVFLTAFPSWAQSLVRPLFRKYEQQAVDICRRASSLTGVSDTYLLWGLQKAQRSRTSHEKAVYLAYQKPIVSERDRHRILGEFDSKGIHEKRSLRCCFFGMLGRSAGLQSITRLAGHLANQGHEDIEFVICGTGPREHELLKMIRDVPNIRFLGWQDSIEIACLMERSDIGLAIYQEGVLQSVPNKPVEYLAGGLPVLTTLRGELETLLNTYNCGKVFQPNDIESMGEWLIHCKQNRGSMNSLSQQASQLYADQFDATKVYEDFIDEIECIPQRFQAVVAA